MLNCLIVDDEPIARDLLESYVTRTPGLQLMGTLDNGLAVINFLSEHAIDLIFLDINMPEFTGIDLLKSLINRPKVILTTAYSEYGAESYEYEVVDYLLKPISFQRFLKAVQKAGASPTTTEPGQQRDFIMLKADQLTHKVAIDVILFVEAYGNYVKVYTSEEMLIARKTLVQIEQELGNQALRVHKSYLVIPRHIADTSPKSVILATGHEIPLGNTYKKLLDQYLRG